MSDIPEGATHTLDGFYFKIKGHGVVLLQQ